MSLTPYYSRDGVTIHLGDVRKVLAELPEQSVHCVVTSPPYWGLRDYGTAQWEGGDAGCDHDQRRREKDPDSKQATNAGSARDSVAGKQNCRKCGAKRIDQQIGQEKTPDEYVATMVEVFRGVRRVLHDSGTVWLNVGDSYSSSPPGNKTKGVSAKSGLNGVNGESGAYRETLASGHQQKRDTSRLSGIKPKDLCMIPFRLAIALQADGWYVRSVICWAKKSCMPESVTDRPTNSWEPIFLLSKRAKYFYDAEAVKEPSSDATMDRDKYTRGGEKKHQELHRTGQRNDYDAPKHIDCSSGRNQRNVWHLGPEPYAEAHFATFPSEIPRRAILAGTSEEGCCPQCLEPWVRVVEKTAVPRREKPIGYDYGTDPDSPTSQQRRPNGQECAKHRAENPPKTTGWQPGCKCDAGKPIKCTVADIFFGSGTTGVVAQELHVNCIGIELNPEYAELARDRFRQGVLNFGEGLS